MSPTRAGRTTRDWRLFRASYRRRRSPSPAPCSPWERRRSRSLRASCRRAMGLGQMPLDAATTAIGDLVLGERGKEAGGRPAFLVGLLGELRPHRFDGGQAQVGEHELNARGVDRIGLLQLRLRQARARRLAHGQRPTRHRRRAGRVRRQRPGSRPDRA